MALEIGKWLDEFAVREHGLYLDHAAVCPLPRSVAAAMGRRISEQELGGYQHLQSWRQNQLACRHLGAELIGCDPMDISIVTSTSAGLSLLAEGLDWQPGDEVLVGAEEFAANVSPWLNLRRRGVKVVRLQQHDGRMDPATVAAALTPHSRLLSVSWVAFHSGWVNPLAELGRVCRNAGLWCVVDAIQGLGVLPIEMRALPVDAIVADSHKWLLGPEGVGLMATTPRLRSHLTPSISGWRNIVRQRGDMFLEKLEYLDDGRRFEAGASNEVGIAGLAAALDLISNIEVEEIQARVEIMARLLTRVLLGHGWDVFSPGSGHPIAGIVAARFPGITPHEAVKRLRERKVTVSTRQGYVRFSPHFYTTRGELEALDRILEKIGM